ncbi:Glycerophosphodiester phosphodiesterase domain-containing protein 1 [Mizuhopecten yessoensis]|uniref:Glycerophosphodiester phosphodiesterase domain-containing protein 1 n=1 Tax=Mizuhopecten yessoensis TaxID=6573 RepID=A0A210PGJ4_MIZYE|nr:Glycerophosphodiester phosphodiesterase domain-containing protein 1 [Mizuhopecten yessoensis]
MRTGPPPLSLGSESLLTLHQTHILHKKKNVKFRPRHISHRGGAGENLENTMTAFRFASDLGTEMLEIDCHITKDGQVVVTHDNSLKRSCGVEGEIIDYDYKDLPPIQSVLSLDFMSSFQTKGGSDRQIPLLKDVFQAFPTMPINIDIKINNDDLINRVNDLILEFDRASLTGWGNRSSAVTSKLYKKNPDVPLIFSMQRVLLLLVTFYTGILPFLPLKESLFEVLMPGALLSGEKFNRPLNRKMRFLLKLADVLMMRPLLLQHLERRGIQTYLWVLNSEEEFERAFKLGSTGVMTDFPTLLKDFLDKSHPELKQEKGYQSVDAL